MEKDISNVEINRKAGRKKGTAKTGGRVKGTPNKKTKMLLDVLGSFDPANELMKLYRKAESLDVKVTICKELMKYVYPQRRAIEIDPSADTGITIVVENKERQKMLEEL